MVSPTTDRRGVALLRIHEPRGDERQVPLHGEGYRIGRDPGMEICIDHGAVSRQHALLQRRGRHWLLQDLGSTNGLWWRGRRVRELELQDGDRISLAPAHEAGAPSLSFENPGDRLTCRLKRYLGVGILIGVGGASLLMALATFHVPVRGRLASVRGPLAIYDGNNQPLKSVDSSRHRELSRLESF